MPSNMTKTKLDHITVQDNIHIHASPKAALATLSSPQEYPLFLPSQISDFFPSGDGFSCKLSLPLLTETFSLTRTASDDFPVQYTATDQSRLRTLSWELTPESEYETHVRLVIAIKKPSGILKTILEPLVLPVHLTQMARDTLWGLKQLLEN